MLSYCSSILNLSVMNRIVDTVCILSMSMKRHYAPDKRCLFVREFNKGSNDAVKEYDIDEDLGPAPTNTCRDETAAKDVY